MTDTTNNKDGEARGLACGSQALAESPSPVRVVVRWRTRQGGHSSETTTPDQAAKRLQACYKQRLEAVAYSVNPDGSDDRDIVWGNVHKYPLGYWSDNPRRRWSWFHSAGE